MQNWQCVLFDKLSRISSGMSQKVCKVALFLWVGIICLKNFELGPFYKSGLHKHILDFQILVITN